MFSEHKFVPAKFGDSHQLQPADDQNRHGTGAPLLHRGIGVVNGHAEHHNRQVVLWHPVVQRRGVEYEQLEQRIRRQQSACGDDQATKRIGADYCAHTFERQDQPDDQDHLHQHFDVPIVKNADTIRWKPVGDQQQRLPAQLVEQHLDQHGVENGRHRDAGNGFEQHARVTAFLDGLELKPCQADAGDQEQHRRLAADQPIGKHMQMPDDNQDDRGHPQEHRNFHGPQ
ncbi:hypothetical protein D3C77_295560 [compost metagenome]